jgi:hypothetical protein
MIESFPKTTFENLAREDGETRVNRSRVCEDLKVAVIHSITCTKLELD